MPGWHETPPPALHGASAWADPDPDDACDGSCISRPHLWSPSGARCTRSGCGVVGTGDPCGDGDCEGEE